jgi:hypothetical protein
VAGLARPICLVSSDWLSWLPGYYLVPFRSVFTPMTVLTDPCPRYSAILRWQLTTHPGIDLVSRAGFNTGNAA